METQTKIPFLFVDHLPAQVGDVNGDGIPDLLLPADSGVGAALGRGNCAFLMPIVEGVGRGVGPIFTAPRHGQSIGRPPFPYA